MLSNKKFFVSVATILKDLNESDNEISNSAISDIDFNKLGETADSVNTYTSVILNKLAKAVERVNLAEKLKLKAEDDRKELKEKVKSLLNKIQKEKELKIEKENVENEKCFQDTISVLQKELNRTRKNMKSHLHD